MYTIIPTVVTFIRRISKCVDVYHCFAVFLSFIIVCNCYPISVKIVKQDNLSSSSSRVPIRAKTFASGFSGPSILSYLVGKCFPHSSHKYDYRVCPFDNITQHERVISADGYRGVIGVWKEWVLKNNTFNALLFENGDDCGEGIERSAQLIWLCNRDMNETIDKVVSIKEPKKCFYEIGFATDFGCEDKHIYQYLSEELKHRWDEIETQFFHQELTEFGYESALNQLFFESGIVSNKTLIDFEDNSFDSVNDDNCLRRFDLLRQQNAILIQRIESLEKQLKSRTQL